jgi:predicted dehydrogenase
MADLKTAIIGCGRIGFLLEEDPLRNKPCTHFGGLKAAGLKVTCACDINKDRLDYFSAKTGLPAESAYTSYKKMFQEHKFDIVTIATWTGSHTDIALDAVNSGAKALILEKPLSHSLKSAEKLMEAASAKGCRIFVNHERRYDHRYRKAGELLSSGKIGRIKTVNARILTGPFRGESHPEQGGGSLLHDGTHLVDLLRFYFGEIISVKGEFSRDSRNAGFEDTTLAWLKTDTDVNIFLESGGSRKYFIFELEIWGSEGKILIGNGYEKLFLFNKSRLYRGFNDLYEKKFPAMKPVSCFTQIYKEAKNLVLGKKDIITSGVNDGYKALEIIHAIYLSAHKKKEITLPVNPSEIDLKKIFNL